MTATIPAWIDGRLRAVDKLEVHRRGLLHPAVSVFLVDGDRTLLQRRALGKYHTPGLWANACCTHPHWGEAPADCASRRLREELGTGPVALRHRDRIDYRAEVGGGLVENERVELFVGRVDAGLALAPDPAEVMDVRWTPLPALRAEITARPQDFTPWLRILSLRARRPPLRPRRMSGERDLARLLARLAPRLDPTPWVFVALALPLPGGLDPLMIFREDEGTTCILPAADARRLGLPDEPVFRRITLSVHSSLEAIGLTAAVASALTAGGISANVVAAFHHDHLFVPADRAEDAMACLQALAGPEAPRPADAP